MACEDEGRDQGDAYTSHETPQSDSKPPKARREDRTVSQTALRNQYLDLEVLAPQTMGENIYISVV